MRPLCLWDKGPPPRNNLTAKVYKGVHTLPPYETPLFVGQGNPSTQQFDY
jgi:hypothetical protein